MYQDRLETNLKIIEKIILIVFYKYNKIHIKISNKTKQENLTVCEH